jgi:nitric oxide reductase subunit C
MECHTVMGDGGYNGGDLTKSLSTRGRDWLLAFFAAPPPLTKNRLHPTVSGANLTDLMSFFEYVDQLPIQGWPPLPAGKK